MHTLQLLIFDMAGTTIDEDNLVYKDVLAAIGGGSASEETALAIHRDFAELLKTAYAENAAKPMHIFKSLEEVLNVI